MELEVVLLVVEDARELAALAAGDVLHRLVRHQEQVELGAQLLQRATQLGRGLHHRALGVHVAVHHRDVVPELGHRVLRLEGELVAENAALDVVVEEDGDHRVLERGHHHHVVDEVVVVLPHGQEAVTDVRLLLRREVVHQDDLEVRAGLGDVRALVALRRLRVRLALLVLLAEDVLDVAPAVGVVHQQADDARRLLRQEAVPPLLRESPELLAGALSGEDPVALEVLHGVEQGQDLLLQPRPIGVARAIPPRRQVLELVPRVRTELGRVVVRAEGCVAAMIAHAWFLDDVEKMAWRVMASARRGSRDGACPAARASRGRRRFGGSPRAPHRP